MKIDVTKISGYDTMSAEEKVAALEAFDAPVVSKEVFDRTASELSAKKKELASHLSEEELAKAADKEARENLQTAYDSLQKQFDDLVRKNQVAEVKASLIALGYDEKTAADRAEAKLSGNIAKELAAEKAHLESLQKKWQTEQMLGMNKPVPDGSSNTMTLDALRKMSPEARLNFAQTHPDEYRELYSHTGGKT